MKFAPHIGFVVAGGLPNDMERKLRPLVRVTKRFSIDMESGVRDDNDRLVIAAARSAITRAAALFS